jgi:hypothetical protein
MRLHRLGPEDVVAIVAMGNISAIDPQGRPVFAGETIDGRSMQVVLALDDPDYVITVFGEVH